MICACKDVPLWVQWLPIHMESEPGPHIPFPVDLYEKNREVVSPFLDKHRKLFEDTENFMANEREYLQSIKKYRGTLKDRIFALKDRLIEQLNTVYQVLDEQAEKIEDKIQAHMTEFSEERELDFEKGSRTLSLDFDIDTPLDDLVEGFVNQIKYWYTVEYESQEKANPMDSWIWSNKRKGNHIKISEDGKTVQNTQNIYQLVMIDVPLTYGKSSWKIQLDRYKNTDCVIGVGDDLDLNSWIANKNFCGFHLFSGNKYIQGKGSEWIDKSNEGDIIEVHLEFQDSIGILRVIRNNEDMGVIWDNLQGPLYPTVVLRRTTD